MTIFSSPRLQKLPAKVYVPCTGPGPDGSETTLELRHTEDGRLALLAYSSIDRLVDCCGHHQPWVALSALKLSAIAAARSFDVVLLDASLPAELRHSAQVESGGYSTYYR